MVPNVFCYNFKNCSKISPKFPQKSVKLISKIQNELFSSDVCYIFTPNLLVFLLRRNTLKTLKHYTCQLKFLTAEWQLGISVDKSNVLFIGKGNSTGQFCINVIPLPVVTECRDLGVTITHDLSLSSHISDIIFKTHQRTNLIHRCFVTRDPNLLVRAFVTYVRPLLEYNKLHYLVSVYTKQDITLCKDVLQRGCRVIVATLMKSDYSC